MEYAFPLLNMRYKGAHKKKKKKNPNPKHRAKGLREGPHAGRCRPGAGSFSAAAARPRLRDPPQGAEPPFPAVSPGPASLPRAGGGRPGHVRPRGGRGPAVATEVRRRQGAAAGGCLGTGRVRR